MAAIYNSLVSGLDSFTPIRVGENGHTELDWSNDIQEKIVQFDFQCVRTNADGVQQLSIVLNDLLSRLSSKHADVAKETKRVEMLRVLYKLIGKTRDIEGGKGEYAISYMMIWTWYKFFPKLAIVALSLFMFEPNNLSMALPDNTFTLKNQVPYGSWKDIKYFCNYVFEQSGSKVHPLIQLCVKFATTQLRADKALYESSDADKTNLTLSLAAKWVPREGSKKFGWLYGSLATDFFPEYLQTVNTDNQESRVKAVKKCKSQYRILCATLNRHLDTVQIKQASNNWSAIDHSKTTSITMAKQRKAFLNQKSGSRGSEQRSEDPDRIECAEHLRTYLATLKKEGKEMKGKNVGLEMFTAQALSMFDYSYGRVKNKEEADILNSQWRDNSNKKNADGLGPMVAIVDTSGSMSGDPMYAAISLGCRVAEKSILGKRVMTFSAQPAWINLEGFDTFTDMVGAIMAKSNTAGMNTDFYKALDLILTVIEEKRIPAEDVENMVLAIFSDMQIDDNLHMMNGANNYYPTEIQKTAARGKWSTMFQQIKSKYAEVGMRMYGVPLNPPHILFWNLRKTNGFPTLSTEAGCSMMSGFDPTVLNMFCEMGMEALKEFNPYKTLIKLLENERYTPLEQVFDSTLVTV
jgi:Domain of unknown function (DUF2828)